MEAPKHLSHKPIVSVNDYESVESFYAGTGTDVGALSIGRAQYDADQISLKVWRHTGKRWSRQSKELPIHRNLDLSILFVDSLLLEKQSQSILSRSSDKLTIDDYDGLKDIRHYYNTNELFLEPRLKELKDILEKFLTNEE